MAAFEPVLYIHQQILIEVIGWYQLHDEKQFKVIEAK